MQYMHQNMTSNTQFNNHKDKDAKAKQSEQKDKDQLSKRYYYKVEGRTKGKYSSQATLAERLKEYTAQKEQPQPSLQQQTKLDNNEDHEIQHRIIRYFDDFANEQGLRKAQKCYRCGKKGHNSSKCFQQKSQIKCYYCLQPHHCNQCKSSSNCNKCGAIGHIEFECKALEVVRCQVCKKKGHGESECGVIKLKMRKLQSEDCYKQYRMDKVDEQDLKNLRCLNLCSKIYAHFSCYNIDQSKEMPYLKQRDQQLATQKYNEGHYTELQDY